MNLYTMTAMRTFIEDYLSDPSKARERASIRFANETFDEERIYEEISSPEFRLYEEVVMSDSEEIKPLSRGFAVVA